MLDRPCPDPLLMLDVCRRTPAAALESITLGPAVIVGPNLQSPICSRQWLRLDHQLVHLSAFTL
jgi:hypothetical protein